MNGDRTVTEWGVLYAAMVLGVAGILLWVLRPVLSPFVLFVLLLVLLSPYAGTRRHVTLVIASSLLMGLWLLDTLGALLAPFILAMVVAYILDPLVDLLCRRGWPRGLVIGLLTIGAIAVVAALVTIALPALLVQVEGLVRLLPEGARRLQSWLQVLQRSLGQLHLPFLSEQSLAWLTGMFSEAHIAAYLQGREALILQQIWAAVLGVGRGFGLVLSVLGYVVLTPVLVIYLLRDFDRITAWGASLMPHDRRAAWTAFLREYDGLLSRYLRGQLAEATLVGMLTWLGLLVLGFPYSGVVGAVAGLFNLIPYLGLPISIIPALFIALLSGNILTAVLKVAVVFGAVQVLDGTVTGPRIVGGSVGLHPVWVMLALAIGGFFFGFVGLLLAMPAAVLVKLLVRDWLVRYRQSRVFRGELAEESRRAPG